MPRRPPAEHLHTPFGDLLIDYMWNQRAPSQPPLTTGQLAVRLGIAQITIRKWIYSGVVPSFDTAMQVFAQLGIPLERAVRAFENAGNTAPPLTEPVQPAASGTASGLRGVIRAHGLVGEVPGSGADEPDEWSALIQRTQADLRDAGVDEATIGAIIDRIRATQIGSPQLAPHIAAEHTEPETPEVTRRRAGSPADMQARTSKPSRPK